MIEKERMKMKISIAIALYSGFLLMGCTTNQPNSTVSVSPSQKETIKVKVDSDRSVQITNATAYQENGTLKVTGILRPKSSATRMAGHIHVSFLDVNGSEIKRLKVEPSVKAFFRRSLIKPRFSVSIALADMSVSETHLKHHDAPVETCSYGM